MMPREAHHRRRGAALATLLVGAVVGRLAEAVDRRRLLGALGWLDRLPWSYFFLGATAVWLLVCIDRLHLAHQPAAVQREMRYELVVLQVLGWLAAGGLHLEAAVWFVWANLFGGVCVLVLVCGALRLRNDGANMWPALRDRLARLVRVSGKIRPLDPLAGLIALLLAWAALTSVCAATSLSVARDLRFGGATGRRPPAGQRPPSTRASVSPTTAKPSGDPSCRGTAHTSHGCASPPTPAGPVRAITRYTG